MKRTTDILVFLGATALSGVPASAGDRTSVRGVGMARTHVAVGRGLDAVGVNPAMLAFPEDGTVTVSLLPAGVHIGSDLLDYSLYTEYFTGVGEGPDRLPRHLSEADKGRILAAFRETDPVTRFDAGILLLGATTRVDHLGCFAATVTEEATGVAEISRGYAEFLLNGNPPGSDYRLSGTKAGGSWVREYAVSFGTAIPGVPVLRALAAGVTVKLVHGYGYYEIQRFDARLVTSEMGVLTGGIDFLSHATGALPLQAGVDPFPVPVGRGVGADLGLAADITASLRVGISVTDIGKMRWAGSVVDRVADTTLIVDDPLLGDQRDAIERVIRGEERSGRPIGTPLPTALGFGVALDLGGMLGAQPGRWLAAADYHQGLVPGVRSVRTPRGSLGVEARPLNWLQLRSGVSVGGTDGVNVAFGLGVAAAGVELAVASENVSWLLHPGSFSHGSLAVGTRLRF